MTLVKVNNPVAKTFDGLFNDLFNEFPAALGRNWRSEAFSFPPVNITENEGSYQLQLAAPGYDKADFNLNLEGNLLSISAEKKAETKEENARNIRKEFSYKAFNRSFTLDENIDSSKINAKYENGILHVELPKVEVQKQVAKQITIQ
ncbi:MAG TPA: Hsp20/alpha crystallin family protein [Ferruginibacter sp.]|nr:Hsp20/alpha crystallin family protein [Ferruginibacter sp.]HMP21774.1 Hsp20/alpha crystallin family protein [Ferruginibacter sp.]